MEIQTIQKQQLRLLDQYHVALHDLQIGQHENGIKSLKLILDNTIMQSQSKELDTLKYSIYMSLTQVSQIYLKNPNEAIYYLHEAIKIKQDFIQWKKLSLLCKQKGYLDQAQYSLKKSLAICPPLVYNLILQDLVEIKLLKQDYESALAIYNDLLINNFRTAKIEQKIQYCRKMIEDCSQNKFVIIKQETKDKFSKFIQKNQTNNKQVEKELMFNQQQIFKIQIGPKSNWNNLIAKIYLIFKYSLNNIQEQFRKKNKIDRMIEDYFSKKKNIMKSVIVLQTTLNLSQDQEKLQSFSEHLLNAKRKKNKESITKVTINQQQKKVIVINGAINLKDYIGNQTVHINSLIHLLSKQKRKELNKIKFLRKINQIIYPKQDLYLDSFKNYESDIKSIQILNQKMQTPQNANQPIVVDDQQTNQKIESQMQIQQTNLNFESIYRTRLQQDLFEFIGQGKSYINIIQLVKQILSHFLNNLQRSASDKLWGFMKESNNNGSFAPSYFLRNIQDTYIKYFLVQLLIQARILCRNILENYSAKITALELLIQKYAELCNRTIGKSKQNIQTLKNTKSVVKKLIIDLEGQLINPNFKIYLNNLTKKQQIITKIRVYHALSIFYSLAQSENNMMLNRILPKYQKVINQIWNLGQQKVLNTYWLQTGFTKQNLREYVQNRVKENKLKTEIQQHELHFSAEIGNVLQNSMQNLKKRKERSASQAIQLYYKNIVELLLEEKIHFSTFLTNLIQILKLYLQIAQSKPAKQDHYKHIIKLDQSMKIEDLAQQLIKRTLLQERKDDYQLHIKSFLQLSNLFLKIMLIKYFILQNEGNNNQVLKGFLCTLNYLVKIMSNQVRVQLVPQILIFLHFLAHIPGENISIHKKIFTHFVNKFIQFLYLDKRILACVQRQFESQQGSQLKQGEEQQNIFYEQARDLLNCYYGFAPKKVNQFNPSTYKDIENFVKYLKCFHTQYFINPSSKIKLPINNILRTCQKALKEAKKQTTFCPQFQQFRKKLIDLYQRDKRDQQFLNLIKKNITDQNSKLCNCNQSNCFSLVKINNPSLLDIYYIISKSLENDEYADNQIQKSEIERAFRHSERFYQALICFDINKVKSWYCLAKINKKKAFVYFDSLVYEEIFSEWKSAFLASKRISSILKEIFSNQLIQDLKQEIEQDNFIMNLLKIQERKFFYMQSREPGELVQSQNTKARKVKMNQGYSTMITKLDSNQNIKIQFLTLVYLKIPYLMKKNFSSLQALIILDELLKIKIKLPNEEQQICKLQIQEIQGQIYFLIYKVFNRFMKLIKRTQTKQILTEISKIQSEVHKQLNLNLVTNLIKFQFGNFIKGLQKSLPELFVPRAEDDNNYFKTAQCSPIQIVTQQRKNYLRQIVLNIYKTNKKVKQDGTIQKYFNVLVANLKASMKQLPLKNLNKKTKLQRFYARCCYYLSKLQLKFENDPQTAFLTINEIVNIKLDDIVLIYRFYQNQSLEKDLKLSQFFNRNLYFMLCKFRYIRYLIKLLYQICDYEKIRQLFKKLIKLIPKDDGPRANKIFIMLHKICLVYSIESLNQLMNKGLLNEQSQKWLYELYQKYIKPKKAQKNVSIDRIRDLLAIYFEKFGGNDIFSDNSINKYEKGVLLLDQKFKKKKSIKQTPETKL